MDYNPSMFSTLPLRSGQDEYHLCRRLEDCPNANGGKPAALPLQDPVTALYFLRGFITDSGKEHELRLWLLSDHSSFAMYSIEDHDILDYTAGLIASGRLVVASTGKGGDQPGAEGLLRTGEGPQSVLVATVGTTPLQDEMANEASTVDAVEVTEEAPPETTWIEIELMDPDGNPVPNEQFKITYADGSVKYGRLDQDGKARIEKLQPGTCQVTFPNRDEEVWDVG